MSGINRNKLGSRESVMRDSNLRVFGFFMLLILFFAAGTSKVLAQGEMFVLTTAAEGQQYEYQLTNSGTAPFTWQILGGEFPSPLNLTSDGKLSGTAPTGRLTPFKFKVRVTDSSNPRRTSTQWLSLTVTPQPVVITSLIARTATVEAAPPTIPISTADEETIALTEQFPNGPPVAPDYGPDTSPDIPASAGNPRKDGNLSRLQAIIKDSIGTSPNLFKDGDYCVVHLIKWKPLSNEGKSEPDRELWALFKKDKDKDDNDVWNPLIDSKNKDIFSTRIFGHKRVVVLLVHLNTPAAWDVKYKVTINRVIPTPIQNVLALAGSIFTVAGADERQTKDIWGARLMMVRYTSSELIVKLNAVSAVPDGPPIEQSKERTNTYVNEGRFHWDVSVGLPVQSVRQLEFKTDGNRVTTAAQGKQSVYGFLNIFLKPQDLKGDDFLTVPHLVFGVPLATKPLHRPFAGIGTGVYKSPIKFNIFAGIVFIRERVPRTLNEGDVATPSELESDLRPRWVRKFMFGINIPIRQIKDAIKTN